MSGGPNSSDHKLYRVRAVQTVVVFAESADSAVAEALRVEGVCARSESLPHAVCTGVAGLPHGWTGDERPWGFGYATINALLDGGIEWHDTP